ncbi:MAG: leucine-rich repeat domain-containing protein [Clostridiales bacterium]|nr:leucine-rich repeat domain-containing protein [Clostridiales bacterium]
MKLRQFVSGFLAMVLMASNTNVVLSAESSEIAETTEIESETAYNDETLSDSAVRVNLMTESTGNTCGDNLTWQLSQIDSSIYYSLTISGSGDMYDFSVASSAPWYKYRTVIKYLYIDSTVTSIGSRAFYDFAITNIDMPESITKIGDYAFGSSELQTVTIPASVNEIGDGPFNSCAKLKSIEVDSNNEYYKSSDGVLFDIDTTELIQYPLGKGNSSYNIPDGIKSINNSAFYMEYYTYSSALTDIYIPASVENIGDGCFYYCENLKKVTFEDSSRLTNIGQSAFMYCTSLTDISIPTGIANIESYTFYGCTSMSDVFIPTGVTSLGSKSFSKCSTLKTVSIMNNATTISEDAFSSCSSLDTILCYEGSTADNSSLYNDDTSIIYIAEISYTFDSETGAISLITSSSGGYVVIPDMIDGVSVVSITGSAFSYKGSSSESNVTDVYIPSSVTNIDDGAFRYNSALENIYVSDTNNNYCSADGVLFSKDMTALIEYPANKSETTYQIPDTVTDIGAYGFYSCGNLVNITISSGITSIYNYTFGHCSSLEEITITNGIISIGDYAFCGCPDLTSITISDSVTSIGKGAFDNCTALSNVEMSNNITYIGASAFRYCSSLENITIPTGVTSINSDTFEQCSSLKSINIPDNVETIDSAAFYGCSSLTSIEIPGSVTSIGANAFLGCSALETITLSEGLSEIGSSALSNCRSLTDITLPNSLETIGDKAFSSCSGLTSITIPGNVTKIGTETFRYCSNLTSVSIPDSITDIDTYAFADCTALTGITLPSNITSIEMGTFSGCSALESIVIPNKVTIINGRAFRGCSALSSITIPKTVTTVDLSVFTNCDTEILILYVEADSYALNYAEENGYNYQIISNTETKKFEMPDNSYSFANSGDSFGYEDGYKISDDIYKMFMSELDFLVFSIPEWSGSCFGIAATCLGFFEYDDERTLYSDVFGLGTENPFYDFDSLYDIPAPNGISELDVLTKWIEIFYASQYNDSSQSIIFSDNYSYSENNWANMDSLVAAIENFAETGSEPIVLCLVSLVSNKKAGHAVVPYDIEDNTETEGCYTVYIYDNNYPGVTNEFYIYKDESGFSGFEYDQYEYAISYIYEQDIYDIVYSVYANSVSLAEADSSESAKIYVNSDNVSIVDSNGTSVENIDGAYEIFYMDSASDTRVFSVPYGEYTVKNNDSSLGELNVSVITSLDGKSISVDDNTAVITLGVYDNGYTYIGANSSSKCSIEITTVNSSGQKEVIEADCTYLFVETTEPDETYIKSSESTVYVNGVNTKVSSSTGTSLSTQNVSSTGGVIVNIGTTILSDEDYYFEESGNTDLSCSDGKITGNICLNLYNKSGSSFSAVVVAAVYDGEGKLVYSENKNITVGNKSNYISLKNLDIEVNKNDSYSCKVFLWKDMLSMRPITAPVDIEIS